MNRSDALRTLGDAWARLDALQQQCGLPLLAHDPDLSLSDRAHEIRERAEALEQAVLQHQAEEALERLLDAIGVHVLAAKQVLTRDRVQPDGDR